MDSQVPGLSGALAISARVPVGRWIVERVLPFGIVLARRVGSTSGALAVEIEGVDATLARYTLMVSRSSFLIAVAPAVLAARALADGRLKVCGLVPNDRQVTPEELLAYLRRLGMTCVVERAGT